MESKSEFAGVCGLYCGVCAILIAHRDNNIKLKEKLVKLYKGEAPGKGVLPNSENLSIDDIKCNGCLSDNRFFHCKQCEIRSCVKSKQIEGCFQCDSFPCDFIENFSMTVGKKVILRCVPYIEKVGIEQWIKDEEARYVCPECGNKVFRGAMRCNKCKAVINLD